MFKAINTRIEYTVLYISGVGKKVLASVGGTKEREKSRGIERGERKVANKKNVDLVQFNALTGTVTNVRMFEEYDNGDFVEVTPGAPERAWERTYFGLGQKEIVPDKLRRKHHDPNLKKVDGGAYINPSRSSRIPRQCKGLRVIKGGLR